MKSDKRVFLVHGWEGNPQNHWFPWLTYTLVEKDFTVFAPDMPNTMHPALAVWLAELVRVVGKVDEQTYFVGHSLGCITIARFLSTLPEGERAGGAVFVAGFSRDLGISEIAEFTKSPVDFGKVKDRCSKFITIYSDNDEYISISESKDFSVKFDAKEILEEGKGHFCASDGVIELPSARDAILTLAGIRSRS